MGTDFVPLIKISKIINTEGRMIKPVKVRIVQDNRKRKGSNQNSPLFIASRLNKAFKLIKIGNFPVNGMKRCTL